MTSRGVIILMITSTGNKKVKDIIQLTQKARERRKQGLFIVEGIKMFVEAPTDRIGQIYVASGLWNSLQQSASEKETEPLKYECLTKLKTLEFEEVSDEVFAKMSDTQTPQGILCTVDRSVYEKEQFFKENGLYLFLENIQDPGNLGTIFRTAEGAGVDGIVMSEDTVDLYNPKTIRSTMGSVYRMPHMYVSDFPEQIKKAKEAGICVYAAHLKGARYYDEFDYQKGTAFLIGNEGNGLKKETADLADSYLKIPMEGKLESLNAAVSAAILSYEVHRQRKNTGRK